MLKIFLTNLGKYNEGKLIGEWVELPINDKELMEVLRRIEINEQYEEFFITDYECDISKVYIHEYDSIENLNNIAKKISELNEEQKLILQGCLEYGYSLEEALGKVDECHIYYDCNSMRDVAIQVVEEIGLLQGVPVAVTKYFDYEVYGRDLYIESCYVYIGNGIYIEVA